MMTALALIAHDRCKSLMVRFVTGHHSFFAAHTLYATKTTGGLIADLGLPVQCLLSGPQGGDLQIGGLIAEGKIDAVIFLRDVLTAQPHEPDITALLRICDVHNVPVATNLATAAMVVRHMQFT